jgi:hypothetical protein
MKQNREMVERFVGCLERYCDSRELANNPHAPDSVRKIELAEAKERLIEEFWSVIKAQ